MLIFMMAASTLTLERLQKLLIGKIVVAHQVEVERVVILQQDTSKDIIMEVLEPVGRKHNIN